MPVPVQFLPDPLPDEPLETVAAWLAEAWQTRAQPNPNAIVLATGGNFLNGAGASALSVTSGRWLVYFADPALNTFGGLASGNGGLWSHTYAGNAPATLIPWKRVRNLLGIVPR